MSMCRVFSCVVAKGYLLWPVCSLGKTLLAFALFHSVLQGQICLLLQVFLDFLLVHSSPLWWKGYLFRVLVLEGFIGFHRTIPLQLLQHYCSGHRLGLLWYWMACPGKTEIILSFLRLRAHTPFHSLVYYDGYSISSKEFLPTVVDIVVIWMKFPHSCPF